MEVIATIDQGTQSTRVYVYDTEAKPIANHHVEFQQHRARAGYSVFLELLAESVSADLSGDLSRMLDTGG